MISGSGGHGAPGQVGETLTIATNGGNGGDLAGSIYDPRVYNTTFSGAQVAGLYASYVPNPPVGPWRA